jgi:hypothetical protein
MIELSRVGFALDQAERPCICSDYSRRNDESRSWGHSWLYAMLNMIGQIFNKLLGLQAACEDFHAVERCGRLVRLQRRLDGGQPHARNEHRRYQTAPRGDPGLRSV